MGTLHGGIQPAHLGYYLDEFTFRFNRRTSKSRGLLFYRLVEQAMDLDPKVGKSFKNGKNTLCGIINVSSNRGKQASDFYVGMWQTLKEEGYWSGEVWNRRKNGQDHQTTD